MFKRNPNLIVHLNSESGIPPIPIFEKKFVIGRKPNHLVAIPDNSISRDHLEVIFQDGQVFVMDLGTPNGTKLDGHRIPANIPTPYHEGQILSLGHAEVRLAIEIFSEDREKRKQNPSLRALQQSSARNSMSTPAQPQRQPTYHPSQPVQQVPLPPLVQPATSSIPATAPTMPANFPPSNISSQPQVSPAYPTNPVAVSSNIVEPPTNLGSQDDAGRILAKAKLEAESIIQKSQTESQKIRDGILEEARREKERIMESIHKYQTEKLAAESQHTQESIRLEKLLSEVRSCEIQLTTVKQQLEDGQRRVAQAEQQYQETVRANQSLVDESKAALDRAKAREAELEVLIREAKTEKESALEFARNQRNEADVYAKSLRDEVNAWAAAIRETTEREQHRQQEQIQAETTRMISERDRTYEETKHRQEAILTELKNTETLKLKNLRDIEELLKRRSEEQERSLLERRTAIEKELLERRESLEREWIERKTQIENDAQELRTSREREYKELKAQQDAYLMDLKKREEDRLKAAFEESRDVIRDQFKIKNENVQKAFDDFFADYANLAPLQIRQFLPELHNQLNKVTKEALTNEMIGEDKQIQQLFEYDPNLQKKHKKFWLRFSIVSVFVLGLVGYFLYNPAKLSEGAQSITESVNSLDLENKKKQAELLERIKQAGIYRPAQDPKFKDTYTDNILYTTQYIEFEMDDQYKSQWIVTMKDFLVQEGKVIDDKADELISKEGSLISVLVGEIPTIDGRNPEKGIMRMRDKENEYIQVLSQFLDEEKKNLLKEKKQAFYERYLNDPAKVRGPAQSQ